MLTLALVGKVLKPFLSLIQLLSTAIKSPWLVITQKHTYYRLKTYLLQTSLHYTRYDHDPIMLICDLLHCVFKMQITIEWCLVYYLIPLGLLLYFTFSVCNLLLYFLVNIILFQFGFTAIILYDLDALFKDEILRKQYTYTHILNLSASGRRGKWHTWKRRKHGNYNHLTKTKNKTKLLLLVCIV